MNRLLLQDLQARNVYPSVTILVTTTPGPRLEPTEQARIARFIDEADRRLVADVPDEVRHLVVGRLEDLAEVSLHGSATHAVALCASPEHSALVRLGRAVEDRVVVDDTFATRDLVADLNRTAVFRVLAVSGHQARLLRGDRNSLVEHDDDDWPMLREEEESARGWEQRIRSAMDAAQTEDPLPTVLAGVSSSVRRFTEASPAMAIGVIRGNHDRTSWPDLHTAAWPIVVDWLRSDASDALRQLDRARSSRRYAGGIDEIWPLANEGRVELVVVESGYSLPVRIGAAGELVPADDIEAPDVVDDIVDDAIEAVMRNGGRAVMVDDGTLSEFGRVAAALRF